MFKGLSKILKISLSFVLLSLVVVRVYILSPEVNNQIKKTEINQDFLQETILEPLVPVQFSKSEYTFELLSWSTENKKWPKFNWI